MAVANSLTPSETVVALAADHAGWELKDRLVHHLRSGGYNVVDLGTNGPESVDYPDFGEAAAEAVATRRAHFGVAVCGSGIGIAMAAGKVVGIRAATVHDETSARLAREHNDANMICLGARLLSTDGAIAAVNSYLAASFEGGRHQRRVDKIDALGRR